MQCCWFVFSLLCLRVRPSDRTVIADETIVSQSPHIKQTLYISTYISFYFELLISGLLVPLLWDTTLRSLFLYNLLTLRYFYLSIFLVRPSVKVSCGPPSIALSLTVWLSICVSRRSQHCEGCHLFSIMPIQLNIILFYLLNVSLSSLSHSLRNMNWTVHVQFTIWLLYFPLFLPLSAVSFVTCSASYVHTVFLLSSPSLPFL